MKQFKADIMVVDDVPANVKVLIGLLRQDNYKVRPTTSGHTALNAMRKTLPDVVLLDINMPDMDGYEVCIIMKDDPVLANIPVIFISALDEVIDKVRAFRVGGADYITKPFEYAEVLARVETHVTLSRQAARIQRRSALDARYVAELDVTRAKFVEIVDTIDSTPLSNIERVRETLENCAQLDTPEIQGIVDTIRHGTSEIVDMVSGLLDLSRVESGAQLDLYPLEMNQWLEATRDTLVQQHGSHVNVTSSTKEALWTMGNSEGLEQLLAELVTNGLKFSDDGVVYLTLNREGDKILLTVEDNGLGIPEQERERIFEKFYRIRGSVHETRAGVGLGLSKVRSIAQMHDGTVEVQSVEGGGSRFVVRLPHLQD